MLDKFCFGILVIFETDKKTAGAETQILDVLTNFFNMIHSSLYTKGRGRESTPAIPDLFNFLSLSLPLCSVLLLDCVIEYPSLLKKLFSIQKLLKAVFCDI